MGALRGIKSVQIRKHMVEFNRNAGVCGNGPRLIPLPPAVHIIKIFNELFCLSDEAERCLCDGTWQEVKGQPLGFPRVSAWVETAVTSRRTRRPDRSTLESDTIAPGPTAVV